LRVKALTIGSNEYVANAGASSICVHIIFDAFVAILFLALVSFAFLGF